MTDKKHKTPEYTRRAIEKYRAGKYSVSVLLPSEYKSIIQQNETSANSYISRLVREDLTRRGLLSDASSAGTDAGAGSADAGGAVSECPF